jgi:hypothetical protein
LSLTCSAVLFICKHDRKLERDLPLTALWPRLVALTPYTTRQFA